MKRALSSLAVLVCGVLAGCDLVGGVLQTVRYSAFYQAYERGFGVAWQTADCLYFFRTDVGEIYIPSEIRRQAFGGYRYCVPISHWRLSPPLTPEMLTQIVAHDDALREALGSPIGDVVRYSVNPSPSTPTGAIMGSPWESHMITLPNGKGLYCGQRAATAGQCNVR